MAEPQGSRAGANAEQAAEWDGPAGAHRTRHAAVFDAEARPHNERLRAAAGITSRDHVLDVGCGTGQTTRDAARAAAEGSALGIDLSAHMLEHARRISRMFFADPVAAFGNIGHALRPGGRLVLMVWQARERNEWTTAIRQAVAGEMAVPPPPAGGPFSLADQAAAGGILGTAGFTGISFTDVHEPVYYGPDAVVALDVVSGLRSTKDLLAGMDAAQSGKALDRLRAVLAAHQTGEGVFFDARAWIIAARRP